jgi:hypothetical protein
MTKLGGMNDKVGRDGGQGWEGWMTEMGGMDDKVGRDG